MSQTPVRVGQYTIKKAIGSGNFGKVYRVTNAAGDCFALKKIYRDRTNHGSCSNAVNEEENLLSEIELLRNIDHICILKYIDSFKDQQSNQWCIITELCSEDLRKPIAWNIHTKETFSENEVLDYFAMLASAIDYLHDKKVIHRDIKPENVLITVDNILKLSDFGIAKFLPDLKTGSFVGALGYMAPEILTGDRYDEKCDVWSLGVLVYELCCLTIDGARTDSKIPNRYSEALQSAIYLMLDKRPDLRPSAKTVFQMPSIQNRLAAIQARNSLSASTFSNATDVSDDAASCSDAEYDVLGAQTTVDSAYISIAQSECFTSNSVPGSLTEASESLTSFLSRLTIDGRSPIEMPRQTVHDLVYCEHSKTIYVTDKKLIAGYKWDGKNKLLKLVVVSNPNKQIESIALAPQDAFEGDQLYISVVCEPQITKNVFRVEGKNLRNVSRLTETHYIDDKCYCWEIASNTDQNLLLIHPSFTSVIYIHAMELRYQKVDLEQSDLPRGVRQINLIGQKLILGNYWFNTLYICDLIVTNYDVSIEFTSQWGPVKAAQGCFGAIPFALGEEREKLYVITKTGHTKVSVYKYKLLDHETNFVPEPIQSVNVKESLSPLCVVVQNNESILLVGKNGEDNLCAVELRKKRDGPDATKQECRIL